MASVRIEEKYEQVRHLISLGRERGYLVYDELNEALPEEIATSVEDIEDLYEALGNHGIEVVKAGIVQDEGLEQPRIIILRKPTEVRVAAEVI